VALCHDIPHQSFTVVVSLEAVLVLVAILLVLEVALMVLEAILINCLCRSCALCHHPLHTAFGGF
jgi:hypothetical protein